MRHALLALVGAAALVPCPALAQDNGGGSATPPFQVALDAALGVGAPESQLWGGVGAQVDVKVDAALPVMAGGRAQLMAGPRETHLQLGPTAGVLAGYRQVWGSLGISAGPAVDINSDKLMAYARAAASGGYRRTGAVVSAEVLSPQDWRPTTITVRVGVVYRWSQS